MVFFKKLIEKSVNLHGKILQKIGEITHIWAIESKGIDMRYFSFPEKKYTKEDSDLTIEYFKLCERVVDEAENSARESVNRIIDEFENTIEIIDDELREIFKEDKGFQKIDSLNIEDFKNELRSLVREYISEEISMNNKEFEQIIKMQDKEKREGNIKRYLEETINKTEAHIHQKCLSQRDIIFQDVDRYLDEYLSREQNITETLKKYYVELQDCTDDIEKQRNLAIGRLSDAANMRSIRALTYITA